MDGDVESHTTEVASASSAGAVGDSRQPPTTPSPTRELLRTTPARVPQALTPSPELIQVRLEDEPLSFILYFKAVCVLVLWRKHHYQNIS